MSRHEKIDYLELPAKNLQCAKDFFSQVFGWSFVDYGPDYIAFNHAGINGGFYQANTSVSTATGSVLIVFYSEDLLATQIKIEEAGGKIIKPLFHFPGGQRFHFADPNGNEYAVWSDRKIG
jgi:uncharacterized protein